MARGRTSHSSSVAPGGSTRPLKQMCRFAEPPSAPETPRPVSAAEQHGKAHLSILPYLRLGRYAAALDGQAGGNARVEARAVLERKRRHIGSDDT